MENEHILVVSDNDLDRNLLINVLEKQGGFRASGADSGESCIKILEKARASLVLLDIMMPGKVGTDVLRQLRGQHSQVELPIIVVTTLDIRSPHIAFIRLGANDVVRKPVIIDVFLARIRTHFRLQKMAKENLRLHARMSALEEVLDLGYRELVDTTTDFLIEQCWQEPSFRERLGAALDRFKERFDRARSLSRGKTQIPVSVARHFRNVHADVTTKKSQRIVVINNDLYLKATEGDFMAKKLLSGKRILCADDDELFRRAVRDELEFNGAIVAEAKNAREAFCLFQEDQFDAVISDARMPGGGGIELLDQIRRSHLRLPFIFLSGDCPIDQEQAFKRGASAFFEKPCEFEGLVKAIATLCDSGQLKWTRKNDRVPVNLNVGIKIDTAVLQAQTVNIGRGGMFINLASDLQPPIGQRIDFDLDSPDNKDKPISGRAVVRWHRAKPAIPTGIGVEFTQVPEEMISALLNRIRRAYEEYDEVFGV